MSLYSEVSENDHIPHGRQIPSIFHSYKVFQVHICQITGQIYSLLSARDLTHIILLSAMGAVRLEHTNTSKI